MSVSTSHRGRDRGDLETKPDGRSRWRWMWPSIAAFVLVGAALAGYALWPEGSDDETDVDTAAAATTAPPTEDTEFVLRWVEATAPPRGPVVGLTATDDGFLAAAHAPEGITFWASEDGSTWAEVGAGGSVFAPGEIVTDLMHGSAGYLAQAIAASPDDSQSDRTRPTIWTSIDGATWHRSELETGMPDIPSPYFATAARVDSTAVGPTGFIVTGAGWRQPDFEAIVAEFAPEHAGDEIWAVDNEVRPEGPVLLLGFGRPESGELVAIPFEDLGLRPVDLLEEGAGIEEVLAWFSSDGRAWKRLDLSFLAGGDATGFVRAFGTDDAFYLFAPIPDPTDPDAEWVLGGFRSVDGESWTEFGVEGPGVDWIQDLVGAKGRLVALGHDQPRGGIWTSTDAQTWTRLDDSIYDVGDDMTFDVTLLEAGGAGFVISGTAYVEMPEDYGPEPVISKDGYLITAGQEWIVLADESTGDVIAEISTETMTDESVQVIEDETGVTFVDIAGGETLVMLTYEEISEAFESTAEEAGFGPPVSVLRYSDDLETWTLDTDDELFGEGSVRLSTTVGDEAVVAVVAAGGEGQSGHPLTVPRTIWIGTPAG